MEHTPQEAAHALEHARILLIDDSAEDRELIERELRRIAEQVVVVIVRDAHELEDALASGGFDLAITDYQLHWSTGLEILRWLKQQDRRLPVVMFTACGSEEIAVEAMKEGLEDYVTKALKHYPRLPYVAAAAIERRRIHQQLIVTREAHERSVRESEERLRRAMNVSTVGVLFFRLDGTITDANEAFQQMMGYSRQELVDHTHWKSLTLAPFHAVTELRARDLLERGETDPYEKQMRRKDGSVWWGLFAPTRLSGTGAAAECVEFVIDISEQRRAQQALEEADRRKDEFLAMLAHELRNPLAPLKNGLQIARLTSGLDATLRRTIDMMERQLNHLVHLVDDLLDVARIRSGKVALRRERVLLREVLAHAVEVSRASIDSRDQELAVEVIPEELAVDGDFDRLAQIFSNLLSNSSKYTGNRGHIRLRMTRDGECAVVDVIDNGIGIPPEDLPKVFELFSQVREHQHRADGGLGIGLSLVQSLVAYHGGSVSAYSAGLGTGSKFTVRLPLLVAPVECRESEPPPPRSSTPSRRRVLVADDNVDAAESMARLIALYGHEVEMAHGGFEVLKKAQAFQPDLLFLDIGMPDLDGLETARRLRATPHGKNAVLVALTGWGQAADRERTTAAGFDAHLVKPIDEPTLRQTLGLANGGGSTSSEAD